MSSGPFTEPSDDVERREARAGRLAVAALWVALALVHLSWLRRYGLRIPPGWDQALYLWTGIEFLKGLLQGGLSGLFAAFLHLNPYQGPLVPLLTVPFYLVAGTSRIAAHGLTLVALGVLLLATFELGRHLRSSRDGLLAAALLAGCPTVISYSRDYLFELPLAALVTVGHLLLVRSEGFLRRGPALGFGITVGAAFLAKTMGPVFLVGAPAWTVLGWRRPGALRDRLINCGLAAAAAAGTAGVWLGANLGPATWYLVHFGFGKEAAHWGLGAVGILAPQSLLHYPLAVLNYGLSAPLALLLAVAAISAARLGDGGRAAATGREDRRGANGFLWAWVVVAYLLLTLPTNKGADRYALPLLPPLALLGARSLNALRPRPLRIAMIGAALLVAATHLLGQTLTLSWLPRHIQLGQVVLYSRISSAHASVYGMGWQDLVTDGWPMSVVPCIIAEASAAQGLRAPRILVVPSHPVINENGLLYAFAVTRCPITLGDLRRDQIGRDLDHPEDHDFVLVKTGDQGPAFANERSQAVGQAVATSSEFGLLRQFPLPDGGSLLIYHRLGPFSLLNVSSRVAHWDQDRRRR